MVSNFNTHLMSRLRRIDWDFAGKTSESPFSPLHWQPGRFASQLPATLIGLLSQSGDTILDPFMGSGITLIEAQRLGRRSIGIDLNPISCLAAKSKTLNISAKSVHSTISKIQQDALTWLDSPLHFETTKKLIPLVPSTVQAEKWYTKNVYKQLGILWNQIQSYKNTKKLLAEMAFSAILLPICRETRHWGYVCDNSTPKTDHEGDVLEQFLKSLDRLDHAYKQRDLELHARNEKLFKIEEANVFCGNTIDVLKQIPDNSVDLVVTSPPYFGVCDYIKAQRLSMEWFGYNIESFRLDEIGARSKRHRQSSYDQYLAELKESFYNLRRVLRPGRICVVVIGESSKRVSIIPKVIDVLRKTNFELKLDLNRQVSSQRRQNPSITGEHILFFS